MRMTRKAATNLSVRTDLVQRARALGLNLSEILEAGLTAAIADAERAQWLAENEEAIDAYNRRVLEHGLWSDGLRRF
ncbi:MAG: type II toxin-antitoxin system CcdA family antitoxin [Myxococcales bacterium]|nr:type II toxin-antitoxin system CcdA family antitoxin [Myxococcales bacterium]